MDNSILVGMVETFALALCALPVVFLGMWLSTKNWAFYTLVLGGYAWIAYVVSMPIYDLWVNPEIGTLVKIVAWSLPPALFIVLNVGTFASIKSLKRL